MSECVCVCVCVAGETSKRNLQKFENTTDGVLQGPHSSPPFVFPCYGLGSGRVSAEERIVREGVAGYATFFSSSSVALVPLPHVCLCRVRFVSHME